MIFETPAPAPASCTPAARGYVPACPDGATCLPACLLRNGGGPSAVPWSKLQRLPRQIAMLRGCRSLAAAASAASAVLCSRSHLGRCEEATSAAAKHPGAAINNPLPTFTAED
eukprot:3263522-Prymnesium_polylepis.1